MKNQEPKNQSMLRRAVVSNLLLVSLFAVLLTGGYADIQRVALDRQLRLRAETLTDFLAIQSQFGMLVNDREGLERIAKNALSLEDVLMVEVKSASGESLAKAARKADPSMLVISRDVAGPGSGGLLEWESTRRPVSMLGSVQAGFSTERQKKMLRSTILFGIAVALGCLIAILAAQYYQMRALLRPLGGLIEFTRQ